MIRKFSAVAAAVVVSAASLVHGQALIDRVPAGALAYVGWSGADAVGKDAEGSRFAAVAAECKAKDLFGRYLDEIEAKITASEPEAREPFRSMRAIAGPMWRYPTAAYVTATDNLNEPVRFTLLTQAGPEAEALAAEVQRLFKDASPKVREVVRTGTAGDAVYLSIGTGGPDVVTAGQPTLASDAQFQAARDQVKVKPAIAWYMNVESARGLADRLIANERADAADQWRAAVEHSGLGGVKSYLSISGFEKGDWVSERFIHVPGPRKGLLDIGAGPLDEELLKAVPASATFLSAGRWDIAKTVREVQGTLGKTDAEALKYFNYGLGAVYQAAGTNLLSNVLDPLGSDWVAYTAPDVGTTGLLGIVVVNKPDDAEKLRKGLQTATMNLTNWVNIGFNRSSGSDGPQMRLSAQRIKIGEVEVNYLAAPILAPSWAIHEGKLYLGLFPQNAAAAARAASRGGPSILDNEKYQRALKHVGVNTPTRISYSDLPTLAAYGSWYSQLQLLIRYAGFGDLFGMTLPEPLLPGIDVLLPNLTPVGGASWVSELGFHSRDFTPLPGAAILSEQGSIAAISGGSGALMTSILLPSLNRARETANRVKSASNLKQMGMGILLYSNENRNRYPDDLNTLFATQDLFAEVLINPNANDDGLPSGLTPQEQIKAAIELNHYVYLGKGMSNSTATAEDIVAYENPDLATEGINVLYGDGHVEWHLFLEGILDEIARQKAARGIE